MVLVIQRMAVVVVVVVEVVAEVRMDLTGWTAATTVTLGPEQHPPH